MPGVTFTDPEVGAVGHTEAQARAAGLTVSVGTAQIGSVARGWIHKAGNDGFIKLIVDSDRGVLVGATSAGPTGGEVLGALTLAVHAEVPVQTLRNMIYAYPTFHRGIEDALLTPLPEGGLRLLAEALCASRRHATGLDELWRARSGSARSLAEADRWLSRPEAQCRAARSTSAPISASPVQQVSISSRRSVSSRGTISRRAAV